MGHIVQWLEHLPIIHQTWLQSSEPQQPSQYLVLGLDRMCVEACTIAITTKVLILVYDKSTTHDVIVG